MVLNFQIKFLGYEEILVMYSLNKKNGLAL